MAISIYRQTYPKPIARLERTALRNIDLDGYAQVPCADGCRNGKFEEPDGNWHEHVECKETGLMWVNLW